MTTLISIRLHGVIYDYDSVRGWSGLESVLGTLTPGNTPDIPDWPKSTAERIRDATGAQILYTQPREDVPGRVY